VSATDAQRGLVELDRCPLCGSGRFTTAVTEPPYSVRRCGECTVAWVTPRLEQSGLVAMYDNDSYWRSGAPKTLGYGDYRGDEQLYLKTFRRRLEFALRDGPRAGAALDVGCAAGFCMQVLAERGFEVHGVEVSETIGSYGPARFGFETVHLGTLESYQPPVEAFDLITMWDVIEHVVDPRALLERARELLSPGGLLVLETQDIDSAFARMLGPRWHHFKHAEHIYHFNPESVRALLASAGFRTEQLTHRFGGKYVSLEFIAERAGRVHPVLSAALRPLTRLESSGVYLNFMDEMVVLARSQSAAASA
jgi:SAM-dependent methyltransferase